MVQRERVLSPATRKLLNLCRLIAPAAPKPAHNCVSEAVRDPRARQPHASTQGCSLGAPVFGHSFASPAPTHRPPVSVCQSDKKTHQSTADDELPPA